MKTDIVQRPQKRRRVSVRTRVVAFATAGLVVASAAGGTAWALDRFVIEHVQVENASQLVAEAVPESVEATESDTETSEVTDNSFTSGETSVEISTVTTGSGENTVTYYVADVQLGDASVLRSAFANDSFGLNIIQTTSEIAEANDAVFAINGDYYGFRDTGIVIRNGVLFRDEGARDGLAIYRDGTVEVYDETATSGDELIANGVWQTLSFGPALVADGQVLTGIDEVEVDTNFGNHSVQGSHPRTAIGVIDDNHLIFVVVDGRSEGYSRGATMTELAQIMIDQGATIAYNLDGGGSSTMYFNGSLVNNPLGRNEERGTSDILYIEGSG